MKKIILLLSVSALINVFQPTLVKAQSCGGSVVCYCNPSTYVCNGCSPTCTLAQQEYGLCTVCGENDCNLEWSECSGQCQAFGGGSCYPGVFCDVGIKSGSCSNNGTNNCGNGVCAGGESCASCPGDCGVCASPPPVCGDGACAATETAVSCPADCSTAKTCGNGSCNIAAGENCNSCGQDCGACVGCGDGACNNGETCGTCAADCGNCGGGSFCGDGSCNGNDTCSNCPGDCGSCSGNFCGNGSCAGSENCNNCQNDCGSCPANSAWFQIVGGSVYAGQSTGIAIQAIPPASTCSGSCKPYLLTRDTNDTTDSVGAAVTGGGSVETDGYTSQAADNIVVIGTTTSRTVENYNYFYRRFSLGLSPTDDFVAPANDPTNAQKPTYNASKIWYYHGGDMTIKSLWNVPAGETHVVFVNGDLVFTDPDNIDQLTNVDNGGFLAFIVSGDILIDDNVNRGNNNTNSNLEGVFIADGQLIVASNGSGDQRFNGEGNFVGWSGVDLQRDLNGNNDMTVPAERFVFRPDFLQNIPAEMKRSQIIWQETN